MSQAAFFHEDKTGVVKSNFMPNKQENSTRSNLFTKKNLAENCTVKVLSTFFPLWHSKQIFVNSRVLFSFSNRALFEEQKEFVAHSYCQLLLYKQWMSGLKWSKWNFLRKFFHILMLLVCSPFLCLVYITSPKRDHRNVKGVYGRILRILDKPFNR